jgi:hypothetical protein
MLAVNYDFAYAPGTLTANKALLTATANNQIRLYSQSNPAFTETVRGHVNGDTASILTGSASGSSAATATTGVGGYAITGSTGTLGASNSNYTFAAANGTLTINPATLTVTGITASNKICDGTPEATLNYGSESLAGMIGSDSVTADATGTFSDKTVGTGKTVTLSGLTLMGAAAGNYVLASSGNEVSTQADITQAAWSIAADNLSKLVNTASPPLVLLYTGFVAGDSPTSLTVLPVAVTTATTNSPAGNYPITVSGAVDPNYLISYVDGSLSVINVAHNFDLPSGYTGSVTYQTTSGNLDFLNDGDHGYGDEDAFAASTF